MNRSPFWMLATISLLISPVAAREVTLNGHVFTLPDDMEIELVAGPPLVNRPITASFDEQGRLYVADSSGSNDKVDKQLAERPHRIVRLEDTNGDGRFDKSLVFADKMMFPEGTLWHDGSLYVAAPPSIWKLTDTDGDGVADRREEWFKGATLTGCANDLHGPYLGPDGWIYWCKGAFAKQTYEVVGKSLRVIPPAVGNAVPGVPPEKTWSTRASHIFRCRPDGSGLEVVMTGGMDNPVDVVFTAGGERVFTTTFFQHPGGGKRDGLIHAIYGGVYGKQHDVIEEHKRTGELMPVLTHLGPAAPCGLAIYESGVIPGYWGNLFACNFNLRKITRHVLAEQGATYKTTDSDFLVSNNLDFHPTDILEDADGRLVVVDTGGWYKLCCPTSQLQKPDVLGAIYRIKKSAAKRIDDPRGATIDWKSLSIDELGQLLFDKRHVVRQRAVEVLAGRGASQPAEVVKCMKELQHIRSPKTGDKGLTTANSRERVWVLTRIDHPAARAAVRGFLGSGSQGEQEASLHSIGLWRDREALNDVLTVMLSWSWQTRRKAVEALGRIGDKSAVPPLLNIAQYEKDRALEHALIYALIEIADPEETRKGLASDNPDVRRVALIALDQMEGGGLKPQEVAARLSSPFPKLKEAAAWIVSRHPEWGGELAGYLRGRLAAKDFAPADLEELQKQLAQFAKSAAVQELLASTAGDKTASSAARRVALVAMSQSGLKELPATWISALTTLLSEDEGELVVPAIAVARAIPVPKSGASELTNSLFNVARLGKLPANVRLEALAAVAGGLPAVDSELFDFLRSGLATDNPIAVRAAAASVLAKARLTTDQLLALAESLSAVGPLEVDKLLSAFEQSTDEAVGLKVISVLKNTPAKASLRPDTAISRLAKYPASVKQGALELAALLNVDLGKQQAKLEELVSATKSGGDVRRGQVVFMRSKLACNTCHQFGYVGGNIGPDLTRIGGIRSERDLVEAIVFPSTSFVRSYEPVVVVTVDGRSISGLLRKDSADEVIVATSATETVRISREDIETIRPGAVSIMPSGLDQQLTVEELVDLVAFLKNAK